MSVGGVVGLGVGAAVVLGGLFAVGGSFYSVDQGEEHIILRNGAYVETVGPGFHTKTPFIDANIEHSLRTETYSWENMESYSFDQQPAHIKVSVTIQPLPKSGEAIYAQYGGTDGFVSRVLTPKVPALLKNVFGQYRAEQTIQSREKLNSDILAEIRKGIPEVEGLINIISVQVEDIKFSDAYVNSIEQKQLATVEVQKRQQELAQRKIEAEITVVAAQAQADSNLAVATAQAQATKLNGEAEAYAIKVKSDALSANPNLIALTTAERWDGKLPTSIPPNGTVPFLNVNPTDYNGVSN